MKKCIIGIVALLYSFISVNMVFAVANTWTQKADFGGIARDCPASFSIGNKGYIGTGQIAKDGQFIYTREFWEYDPEADIWTQKADFGGTERLYAVGFSIGNKGYMGTGEIPHFVNVKDFWEYDPALNTWTQKADFGGGERNLATGFSIGSKGYIGTGGVIEGGGKDFWEYDPVTDTWTRKADFGGIERGGAVSFAIGNKGYLGTGAAITSEGFVFLKDFWEYDPVTDTWTQKADFGGVSQLGTIWAVGLSIGSKGYIGTAAVNTGEGFIFSKDFWEYDPVTDTWTQKADFGGEGRIAATGFSIGNKGYIGLGSLLFNNNIFDPTQRTSYNDFWEYAPGNSIFLVPVADKSSLWPPNNKMVPVSITANVSSDGPVTLTAQVSCNEPAKRGTDWTEPVINQATGVILLSLRATRAGSGTGRVYTITIKATDANGNFATETVTIVVPHDQGKKASK
jgi:hypothetical protein